MKKLLFIIAFLISAYALSAITEPEIIDLCNTHQVTYTGQSDTHFTVEYEGNTAQIDKRADIEQAEDQILELIDWEKVGN